MGDRARQVGDGQRVDPDLFQISSVKRGILAAAGGQSVASIARDRHVQGVAAASWSVRKALCSTVAVRRRSEGRKKKVEGEGKCPRRGK